MPVDSLFLVEEENVLLPDFWTLIVVPEVLKLDFVSSYL